jgi:PTS system fructose-specific IIC component
MRITELLKKESIELGVALDSKDAAIDRLTGLMEAGGRLHDRGGYKEGILARESQGSTAIGDGIAIPHAKVEAVKEAGLAAVTVPAGVDYEAFDGSLANLIFMIAAPAGGADVHLEALARLSTLLMTPNFKDNLIQASSKEEFLRIIDQAENDKYGEKEGRSQGDSQDLKDHEAKQDVSGGGKEGYRLLAVTACPTGIAHTYMAAENLESTAKKMGISLKAETDGSGGAQNVLTREEIATAEAIIVAADREIEMARFDGKPVLQVPVADGIHKAKELIEKAASGQAPVYRHAGGGDGGASSAGAGDSAGRKVYKHLMNGVSHMLPFVIGGGVLIALAFLFDDYSVNPANFGKNTPLAAYLKTIGEQAFGMMLPVLSGYIAMSIADRPGLAVGFVSGIAAKAGMTFSNPDGGAVNAGFLGALFAGFAAGYLVLELKKLFSKLPKSLEGIKPVLLYPVLGIFLGAVATTFINPYMGMINDGLTGFLNGMGGASRIVLGMIVGGMMSIDMGGPFNKAAYVFGTAQLAEGNFEVMAAVMAGGMVPPIAIALCTMLFKKKFTKKECQSGIVNIIMGLSFITEGAIPFAASDPVRIIPSCAAGAAVAGGLSMFFGCTIRAPHGGIFVLPTVGNPFGYLGAVIIGSAVGCVILGLLKKELGEDER